MTDIAFVRKVLEFVEQDHIDTKHEQGVFVMTPEIAVKQYGDMSFNQDGQCRLWLANQEGPMTWTQAFGQDCQTAACIAGTACLLDPDTEIDAMGDPSVDGHRVVWDIRARELLGLDIVDANAMFWEMDNDKAISLLRDHLVELEAQEAAL